MLSKLLIVIVLTLSLSVHAQSNIPVTTFNKVYDEYKASLEQNDQAMQLKAAEKAYLTGQAVFGKYHLNTANVGFDLGVLYNKTGHPDKAEQTLLEVKKAYLEAFGEQSKDMIALYFELVQIDSQRTSLYANKVSVKTIKRIAKSNEKRNQEKSAYLDKILAIASKLSVNDPQYLADVQFKAAQIFLPYPPEAERALQLLEQARLYYVANHPADSLQLIYSNYLMGDYYYKEKDYDKAQEYLALNLPVFDKQTSPTHPIELVTHALLVKIYEETDQTEKSAYHSRAIGKMRPWSEAQEQVPLYQTEAPYPKRAWKKKRTGKVRLAFTVNPDGKVVDPEVVYSEGGSSFEKSALKTIISWRYAPKFEEGEAVPARTQAQINFNRVFIK